MKNKSILVHCSYSDTGPALEELVRESFRVYLKKELPAFPCEMRFNISNSRFVNINSR